MLNFVNTTNGTDPSWFGIHNTAIKSGQRQLKVYTSDETGSDEVIDADQAWFWTEEWQEGERKVDEYIAAGDFETFDSIEEFLDTLGN